MPESRHKSSNPFITRLFDDPIENSSQLTNLRGPGYSTGTSQHQVSLRRYMLPRGLESGFPPS